MHKVPPRPTIFRHSSHAEWGFGIVVADNPDKIYLSFENGGRRVFAKAPKYRHLLVSVDLPSGEADALIARLAPSAKSPKSADGKKKAKKAIAASAAPVAKGRARRSAPGAPSAA